MSTADAGVPKTQIFLNAKRRLSSSTAGERELLPQEHPQSYFSKDNIPLQFFRRLRENILFHELSAKLNQLAS